MFKLALRFEMHRELLMIDPCTGGGKADKATFDLGIICLWFPHQQCRCFTIEWVCRVGVQEQLREKRLEDVEQIYRQNSLPVSHTTEHRGNVNTCRDGASIAALYRML